MRNRSFATLGTLALLAAASAFGQQKMVVNVPFEFHFADAIMPAGQYEVDLATNNVRNLLSLDCYACQVHMVTLTSPIGGGIADATNGRMVLHKYGNTYFLSEVWAPGYALGGVLAKTKTEREIARNTRDVSRVTLAARTTNVTIARR